MKKIKNSRAVKSIALIMAICVLVLPVFTSCESVTTQWELSEDESVLYRDGVPYYRIEDESFDIIAHKRFQFSDTIEVSVNDEYSTSIYVYSYDEDGTYVWVSSTIYATEEGMRSLEGLKALDEVSGYCLDDGLHYSVIGGELIDAIFNDVSSTEAEIIDFAYLGYRTDLNVSAKDTKDSIWYSFAKIYLINGVWYYLDLSSLSEEHFDEDGKLNYRDGQVEVYPLSEDTCEKILAVEAAMTESKISATTEFESDLIVDRAIEKYGATIGTIVIVFSAVVLFAVGFILPLPVYALGLILPRIKRLGKPKYWYSLCALAGMWTLLSVLMFIVVTLAVLI